MAEDPPQHRHRHRPAHGAVIGVGGPISIAASALLRIRGQYDLPGSVRREASLRNQPNRHMTTARRISVIDSHTGGEPTRVVVAGGPDLGARPARRTRPASSANDSTRSARASSTSRAAPTCWSAHCSCEPHEPGCVGGRDLLQQRRHARHVRPRHDRPGRHARPPRAASRRASTASRRRSASSTATLHDAHRVTVGTCRATAARRTWRSTSTDWAGDRRHRLGRQLVLPREGSRRGHCAIDERRAADRRHLADPAGGERGSSRTRRSITSSCSARRSTPPNHSRNFVLCPGKAYDRSPCGTGTSAKLACLVRRRQAEAGRGVAAGEHHRQRLRGDGSNPSADRAA